MKKYVFLLGLFVFIGACSQSKKNITAFKSAVSYSNSSSNVVQLKHRFKRLQDGYGDVIRITQFGDSHSAADLFTGRLRTVLQRRYGNAGIGWVSPLRVRGQRHDKITHQSSDWRLFDSRHKGYDGSYPMGGYVAKARSEMAFIRLNHKDTIAGEWLLKLLVKYNELDDWQVANYTTTLPVEIAGKEDMEIGGIWLTKASGKGVIVETIAANGAKNTLWNKWGTGWLKRDLATLSHSDMVILAYGTNEAFNKRLSVRQFTNSINRRVQQIRRVLPKAVILIIGAPESYKKRPSKAQLKKVEFASEDCQTQRPLLLTQIQRTLANIAKQQGTLYWDWQKAMGGQCQVPDLINQGLMQKDGIHFTRRGYQYSADKLISYLQSIGLIQ